MGNFAQSWRACCRNKINCAKLCKRGWLYPEFSKFGVLQLQEETAVAAKPYLLALDGDEEALKTIAKVVAPHFTAMVTRDPRKFLAWMENLKEVGAVLTEHVLQTANGVSLL